MKISKKHLDFVKKHGGDKTIQRFAKKLVIEKYLQMRINNKHEILENISKRPKDDNSHTTLQRFKGVMQLESLAEVLKDTSLCGLGKKASNPVLTTLKWFREEYEDHIFERKCEAGVCQELRTFEIDVDACTGCTLCAKKCPTGAIFGTAKNAHFIVQDKCIGCTLCYTTCKFSAIISK